jgi:suppressor of G2 allele of SKP1
MDTVGENDAAAAEKKEYVEEVRRLDEALKHSTSPTWLLDRSKAHQHLGNFAQALSDVEAAYHSAVGRGSDNTRNLIIDAQYRRAVILFAMGRYADADCCARWSQNLADLRPANEDDGVGTGQDLDGDGFYNVTEADARAQVSSNSPQVST